MIHRWLTTLDEWLHLRRAYAITSGARISPDPYSGHYRWRFVCWLRDATRPRHLRTTHR